MPELSIWIQSDAEFHEDQKQSKFFFFAYVIL